MAALCEPARVVDVLDSITASLVERTDRGSEEARVLRQALGYGWSVAIVGARAAGQEAVERWLDNPDRDIRWIVHENLKQARLARLDDDWVARCRARLGVN